MPPAARRRARAPYGGKDETCPLSMVGRTRRVQLVRGGRGGGAPAPVKRATVPRRGQVQALVRARGADAVGAAVYHALHNMQVRAPPPGRVLRAPRATPPWPNWSNWVKPDRSDRGAGAGAAAVVRAPRDQGRARMAARGGERRRRRAAERGAVGGGGAGDRGARRARVGGGVGGSGGGGRAGAQLGGTRRCGRRHPPGALPAPRALRPSAPCAPPRLARRGRDSRPVSTGGGTRRVQLVREGRDSRGAVTRVAWGGARGRRSSQRARTGRGAGGRRRGTLEPLTPPCRTGTREMCARRSPRPARPVALPPRRAGAAGDAYARRGGGVGRGGRSRFGRSWRSSRGSSGGGPSRPSRPGPCRRRRRARASRRRARAL